MPSLTKKEKEALLILFKDFTTFYNANSLSKTLKITRVGTLKLLRRLKKEDILISRKIGKSITYKLDLDNDYNEKLISFLLADEANKFKRWKREFEDLNNEERVVMIYGSILVNTKKAKDIDILLVIKRKDYNQVSELIDEKQKIMQKRIHPLIMISGDLVENIKNKRGAILNIVKSGVILYGQNKYVKLVKESQEEFLNYFKCPEQQNMSSGV
ncbi:MAG: hypothetical protein MAG795_01270 [Candidatus Woesearchaeota archaeon]|nr:hypothetical protein [Candidatus Woesearchaeota archaeon]